MINEEILTSNSIEQIETNKEGIEGECYRVFKIEMEGIVDGKLYKFEMIRHEPKGPIKAATMNIPGSGVTASCFENLDIEAAKAGYCGNSLNFHGSDTSGKNFKNYSIEDYVNMCFIAYDALVEENRLYNENNLDKVPEAPVLNGFSFGALYVQIMLHQMDKKPVERPVARGKKRPVLAANLGAAVFGGRDFGKTMIWIARNNTNMIFNKFDEGTIRRGFFTDDTPPEIIKEMDTISASSIPFREALFQLDKLGLEEELPERIRRMPILLQSGIFDNLTTNNTRKLIRERFAGMNTKELAYDLGHVFWKDVGADPENNYNKPIQDYISWLNEIIKSPNEG